MTVCSAPGCSRNSRHVPKLQFFKFPSNPERRMKWLTQTKSTKSGIEDPSRHFRLCQLHFEESCFQISGAVEGKRRLTRDAIPTIFEHRPMPKHRKPPALRVLAPVIPTLSYGDHNYSKSHDEEPPTVAANGLNDTGPPHAPLNCEDGAPMEDPLDVTSPCKDPLLTDLPCKEEPVTEDFITLFEPAQVHEQVVKSCEVSCFEERLQLKHELAVMAKRLSEMRKKLRRSVLENTKMKKAQENPKKHKRKVFKPEEIETALKLRISCGFKGYATACKEYPQLHLPCEATLYRHTKNASNVPSKILDVFLDSSEFADVKSSEFADVNPAEYLFDESNQTELTE